MARRALSALLLAALACDVAYAKFGRYSFPEGFIFGTGSASYQYEGAYKEGGKGPSVWDIFSHIPGKIKNNDTGDVAVDFYHRYKEDVKLLKDMNMDAFRFSIAWTRILPTGSLSGGINKEGVAFYNSLINEVIANETVTPEQEELEPEIVGDYTPVETQETVTPEQEELEPEIVGDSTPVETQGFVDKNIEVECIEKMEVMRCRRPCSVTSIPRMEVRVRSRWPVAM